MTSMSDGACNTDQVDRRITPIRLDKRSVQPTVFCLRPDEGTKAAVSQANRATKLAMAVKVEARVAEAVLQLMNWLESMCHPKGAHAENRQPALANHP